MIRCPVVSGITLVMLISRSCYVCTEQTLSNLTDEKLGSYAKALEEEFFERRCPLANVNVINELNAAGRYEDLPIQIELYVSLHRILLIDDLEKTLSVLATVKVWWTFPSSACTTMPTEEFLKPRNIPVPPIHIDGDSNRHWFPEILHTNGVEGTAFISADDATLHFKASSDPVMGELSQTRSLKTSCKSKNLTIFPFDRLECTFELEPNTLRDTLDITSVAYLVMSAEPLLSDEDVWTIDPDGIDYSMKRISYSRASLKICFDRKPSYYMGNVFLLIIVIKVIQLTGILMMPNEADRPMFFLTAVLSVTVLLTFIFDRLPKTTQFVYVIFMVEFEVISSVAFTVYTLITRVLAETPWGKFNRRIGARLTVNNVRILDFFLVFIDVAITMAIVLSYKDAVDQRAAKQSEN